MVTTNCQRMSGPSAKFCAVSDTPPARHSVLLTAILLSQQRASVSRSQRQVIDSSSGWDTWDSKKELTKRYFWKEKSLYIWSDVQKTGLFRAMSILLILLIFLMWLSTR